MADRPCRPPPPRGSALTSAGCVADGGIGRQAGSRLQPSRERRRPWFGFGLARRWHRTSGRPGCYRSGSLALAPASGEEQGVREAARDTCFRRLVVDGVLRVPPSVTPQSADSRSLAPLTSTPRRRSNGTRAARWALGHRTPAFAARCRSREGALRRSRCGRLAAARRAAEACQAALSHRGTCDSPPSDRTSASCRARSGSGRSAAAPAPVGKLLQHPASASFAAWDGHPS